jgi:hypothetical protein
VALAIATTDPQVTREGWVDIPFDTLFSSKDGQDTFSNLFNDRRTPDCRIPGQVLGSISIDFIFSVDFPKFSGEAILPRTVKSIRS